MSLDSPDRARATTLADVAKAASVSIATASYVLSKRADVTISPATRERVVAASARLHYRRNALAAALRSGAAREIGLFAALRPRGAMADITFACAEVAASRCLSTAVHIGSVSDLDVCRFDGVIIVGDAPHDATHAKFLDGSLPVVEIGGAATQCQVHADDFGGARKGLEHLLNLGHRQIAHFAGPQTHMAYQERLRGFLDGVHEAGLRMDATPVIHGEAHLAEVLRGRARPTALLAYNGEAAALTYRHLRALGRSAPTDLSVVGFDDENLGLGAFEPPLTTVDVAPEAVAGAAFLLLERQFARESVPSLSLVPTRLTVRASTESV
ncbi:MAG: LacI family DNA-binding transcriptional regulator [Fimbriimonadaceae bacterium]